MRRASLALAALLALTGLTACAMKDEAPQAGAAQAPEESMAWREEAADDNARGGDLAEKAQEAEPAPMAAAKTAAPAAAAARGMDFDAEDDSGDLANPFGRAEPMLAPPAPPADAPAADPSPAVNQPFDGDGEDANGLGGLGLRGSGQGGGGQGFGRVEGLAKLDVGGGKGYGRGPGATGKKSRKKRAPARRPTGNIDRGIAPAKPKPVSKSSLSRRDQTELDGLFADDAMPEPETVEEPKEIDEEEEVVDLVTEKSIARDEVEKEKKPAFEQANRRDDWAAERTRRQRSKNKGRTRTGESGGEFQSMLTPLDGKDIDGRFAVAEYPERFVQPDRFIPRMCYFENTYLGGNAAYTERLRRLDDALPSGRQPYRQAVLPQQPFDAPDDAGLALTATLDRAYADQPQRVFLQVGLQGSKRYGWRRPPLDIALVVDRSAADGETLVSAITALSRRLGPQDRLGVVLGTTRPTVLGELAPLRDRLVLARAVEALGTLPPAPPGALAAAMSRAGGMLQGAAGESARIPGTQTVLVLTRDATASAIDGARGAAHGLTVQGAVTSVIQLGGSHQGWWQVANAGHGNYHRSTDEALGDAVDDELGSISRVIARLLRINVKLADGVEAIRIVGSRVLGQQEVKQVKAREEATDRNLSKTMGVKADRGDDDDGIQTVIPYFYGGDSHVILLELWVTRPGPVAEISLKYKDMVALQNATARVAAQLDRVPRELSPAERRVAANVRGFQLAEGLANVADYAARGDRGSALQALDALDELAWGRDRRLVDAFEALVRQRGADATVAEALRMARDRRIGHSP